MGLSAMTCETACKVTVVGAITTSTSGVEPTASTSSLLAQLICLRFHVHIAAHGACNAGRVKNHHNASITEDGVTGENIDFFQDRGYRFDNYLFCIKDLVNDNTKRTRGNFCYNNILITLKVGRQGIFVFWCSFDVLFALLFHFF